MERNQIILGLAICLSPVAFATDDTPAPTAAVISAKCYGQSAADAGECLMEIQSRFESLCEAPAIEAKNLLKIVVWSAGGVLDNDRARASQRKLAEDFLKFSADARVLLESGKPLKELCH